MEKLTRKEWKNAIDNFLKLPPEEQVLFNAVLANDVQLEGPDDEKRKRIEKTIRYLAKGDWDAYR